MDTSEKAGAVEKSTALSFYKFIDIFGGTSMNILNGIVGGLIGGGLVLALGGILVWTLGKAYGEGIGAAKSLVVVGKKAGNEDIKLYIDHKIARDEFITKMIFMQGLNDQLDDYIEAINSMNENKEN